MRLTKKSQFSGFFTLKNPLTILWFCFLAGCEPALEHLPEQQLMDKAQQGNGAAAVLLAKKREQQADFPAALNWYQKAIASNGEDLD